MRSSVFVGPGLRACRRASARRARPRELLRRTGKACFDWIPFDVPPDARAFLIISDEVIVAFVLPEGDVLKPENPDRLMAGIAFERTQPYSCRHMWRDEQMDVIRHDYEGVNLVAFKSILAVEERTDKHRSDFWLPQKERSGFGSIQKPIQCYKSLTACKSGIGKAAIYRKAAVQPESYEHPFPDYVAMRESSVISHLGNSCAASRFSQANFVKACAGRKPGGRPEGLPHQTDEYF